MAEEFKVYKLKVYGPYTSHSSGAPLDTTLPLQEVILYIPKVNGISSSYTTTSDIKLYNYITGINTPEGNAFMLSALIGYSNAIGEYGSTLHGSFRSTMAKGWRYVDLNFADVGYGYQMTLEDSDYYVDIWLSPPDFMGMPPYIKTELVGITGGGHRYIFFPIYDSYSTYFRASFVIFDDYADYGMFDYNIYSSSDITNLDIYMNGHHMSETSAVSWQMLLAGVTPVNPDKPYPTPQPESDPDVPTGENDFHSDPVPIPALPTLSAVDTGFTRLFNPSLSQLNDLANYMWTDNSFWTTLVNKFQQMLEDPMKYIISLNLLPVSSSDMQVGPSIPVKLLFIQTNVSMPPIGRQFVPIDCGTYTVKRNYGSALDFSPNTKVSLYLPYIGVVPLDVDEIMPSPPDDSTTLGINYVVDIFSGTCVAMVTVNGDVKYQFSGHCSIAIPFASADFSTYQGALIQAAKTVVGGAASLAGASTIGSALLGAPVQKTSETVETVTRFNPETNRKLSPWEDTKSSVTKAQFGSLLANNITNTVSQVAASKPNVERSAGFSGNTGYMAVRRPYLIFESPRLVNPDEYGAYNGYPSMMYLSFANLIGFTQVQQIQLKGFSGTNPEIDELLALLKSGVIF